MSKNACYADVEKTGHNHIFQISELGMDPYLVSNWLIEGGVPLDVLLLPRHFTSTMLSTFHFLSSLILFYYYVPFHFVAFFLIFLNIFNSTFYYPNISLSFICYLFEFLDFIHLLQYPNSLHYFIFLFFIYNRSFTYK